ncbi:MAG: ECF-type sigma factor [Tahibacter sp.]
MSDSADPPEITVLLNRWRNGDKAAESRLIELLYPALRQIAQRALRPSAHQISLRATELVHEAYLRLHGQRSQWSSREHFLAISARVTRYVLIDLIRERDAQKRGAGVEMITLQLDDDSEIATDSDRIDWLALEQGLQQLETRDAIAGRIVELRYFGGLTNAEVATVLDIGVATVVRHWKFARAWLHRRL